MQINTSVTNHKMKNYYHRFKCIIFVLILFVPIFTMAQEKHRLIVLTDIEADPDDSQSLVRLLLYSNQIDIEGLIATTSTHQKERVAPETIHRILEAYNKVQPNLVKHEAGFPSAKQLHSLVVSNQWHGKVLIVQYRS